VGIWQYKPKHKQNDNKINRRKSVKHHVEEMIAQMTERSIKAKNQIMKNTYVLIHSLN